MKKLIFPALIGALLLTTTPTFAIFSDVDVNTNYQTAILWMQDNQVINGYTQANTDLAAFKPDQCVTRAEFLKMLFKMLAIDSNAAQAELFTDTSADAWYAPYVRTARARKTIQGYADGSFKPNQCVNRSEAIKMATLEFNDGKLPDPGNATAAYFSFSIDEISAGDIKPTDWFFKYDKFAIEQNTIGLKHLTANKGHSMSYLFHPIDPISRKEVAEMLYRMKAIKDNKVVTYDDPAELDNYKEMGVDYKFVTPNALVTTTSQLYLKLNKVILTSSNDPKIGDIIDFDVYIDRTDLGIKEDFQDNGASGLSADLTPQLQPKLMYISEVTDTAPDSGEMCDRPRYPHRCTVRLTGDDLLKSSKDFLVKITFDDANNSYASTTITVPHPTGIDKPEILAPTTAPVQNSTFEIKFKDIGASSYQVGVNLCKKYNNDGINPCLDGMQYELVKEADGKFLVHFAGEAEASADYPAITAENGVITFKSPFKLTYLNHVEYSVNANKAWTSKDGVRYTLQNSDAKSLQVASTTSGY